MNEDILALLKTISDRLTAIETYIKTIETKPDVEPPVNPPVDDFWSKIFSLESYWSPSWKPDSDSIVYVTEPMDINNFNRKEVFLRGWAGVNVRGVKSVYDKATLKKRQDLVRRLGQAGAAATELPDPYGAVAKAAIKVGLDFDTFAYAILHGWINPFEAGFGARLEDALLEVQGKSAEDLFKKDLANAPGGTPGGNDEK